VSPDVEPGPGPGPDHWFEPMADHLGAAYLRYSFTRGTGNEVAFLSKELGLVPGSRVLDVGCGPGRHALALAEQGIEVVGVDISPRFVELARAAAEGRFEPDAAPIFRRLDARELPFEGEFDAAISLCQGAFGLQGLDDASERAGGRRTPVDPDGVVLAGMARALRPGGRLAVSAFSAYFQVRYLESSDDFDADRGVNHEHTAVRSEQGVEAGYDLWTSCFTPRELRMLAASAGLEVQHLWSVTPGAYGRRPPDLDHPEFLMLARRPA
jgi:SAM-dependent methyltransferase